MYVCHLVHLTYFIAHMFISCIFRNDLARREKKKNQVAKRWVSNSFDSFITFSTYSRIRFYLFTFIIHQFAYLFIYNEFVEIKKKKKMEREGYFPHNNKGKNYYLSIYIFIIMITTAPNGDFIITNPILNHHYYFIFA